MRRGEVMDTATQKWAKGSMSAAKQITRSSKLRMVAVGTILREEADKEFCEIISRETHDQEMAEFVREVAQNGRLWRVLDEDQWNRLSQKAEALLSTLEKI